MLFYSSDNKLLKNVYLIAHLYTRSCSCIREIEFVKNPMLIVGLKVGCPRYLHHFSNCDDVICVEVLCDGFISMSVCAHVIYSLRLCSFLSYVLFFSQNSWRLLYTSNNKKTPYLKLSTKCAYLLLPAVSLSLQTPHNMWHVVQRLSFVAPWGDAPRSQSRFSPSPRQIQSWLAHSDGAAWATLL